MVFSKSKRARQEMTQAFVRDDLPDTDAPKPQPTEARLILQQGKPSRNVRVDVLSSTFWLAE
jgi:hypothetical protein